MMEKKQTKLYLFNMDIVLVYVENQKSRFNDRLSKIW